MGRLLLRVYGRLLRETESESRRRGGESGPVIPVQVVLFWPWGDNDHLIVI